MQTDILHRFLQNGLIEIGPEDERLTRLRAAAAQMASSITAERHGTPRFAMVAFDPKVSGDDPVLDEVAEAVAAHWATYRSAFADRPITVFRAVLLDGLRQAQEEDSGVAAAVALTTRNMLPHFDLGREKEILSGFAARSEELLSENVLDDWSTEVGDTGPKHAIPAAAKPNRLDRKVLLAKIEAAVGPTNEKGEAGSAPNSHWPNQGQPWSFMFAPKITAAIAESVDAMSDAVMNSRAKVDEALINAMKDFVGANLPTLIRASTALERRLDLLWWRQSLYSNPAKRSYRSMRPAAAAMQMAADVFASVSVLCPPSVEYFLREAVAEVVGDTRGKSAGFTFKQIANEASSIRSEVAMWWPAEVPDVGPGRRPLVSFLWTIRPKRRP
ncbi:hypothetical protein HNQ36_002770 [Afipia massiliensis]|uniref:GTPase-associated system helical domain-containing protein n=1 Tax=Afipia massiliensis TaxID=211460 RepID=A0A840N7V2_9BRAD|nr:GTPase-associated system all-helical protein GASH [Afipia massiliensis]MBB5052796.1 hypothetical protein [Afipia massiliensis]